MRFKSEFVYDSPKNLVHKSQLKITDPQNLKRRQIKIEKDDGIKKQKLEEQVVQEYIENENEEEDQHIMFEVDNGSEDNNQDEEKLEILYVQEGNFSSSSTEPSEPLPPSKEEKFIAAIYPQFKGKTKLQLIDEIFDLKRQNELLTAKVKTYENTIHKLL